MNKKLLLASAVMTAGFFALTAFAPKTQEEQRQEIQQSVQVKLDTYRDSLMMACDERIAMEADRRFNEAIAARAMDNTPTGTKGRTKGPKVKPLPTGKTPGKTPEDEKRDRMENKPTTPDEKRDRMDNKPTTPDSKRDRMRKQNEGGGN